MEKKFRKIGVLTSGGDAPGMNAAVRAITCAGLAKGVEIMGIYEGYSGLIRGNIQPLCDKDVSGIIDRGGTILYSARCLEFIEEPGMQKAIESCKNNEIDGIVAIGGDGTFRGAADLTERGIPCIGIPGTIDNDITSTDYSIGFDTAMNTVVSMVDRLRDTCESHARCNVVEVMGRDAGYIALESGIAVGASAVALVEIPFNEKAAIEKIKKAKDAGKRSFIVIIAEGIPLDLAEKDAPFYSENLAKRIQKETGVETKFARLAHVVRGGSPSLRDRLLASKMGHAAVELLLAGKSSLVVCEQKGEIVPMDIGYALTLDRMYKDKLKECELNKYSQQEIESMRAFCKAKHAEFRQMYEIANALAR